MRKITIKSEKTKSGFLEVFVLDKIPENTKNKKYFFDDLYPTHFCKENGRLYSELVFFGF